jgi:hypothetical protein
VRRVEADDSLLTEHVTDGVRREWWFARAARCYRLLADAARS